MNADEIKNVIPLIVTLLTPLAAKYGFSVGDLTATLTGAIGIGLGIYMHWNQKKVPETALVVKGV
jgi:hypothetical protein